MTIILVGEVFSVGNIQFVYDFHNASLFHDYTTRSADLGVLDVQFGSNLNFIGMERIDTSIKPTLSELDPMGVISFVISFSYLHYLVVVPRRFNYRYL